MRKISFMMSVSVDGFMEGPNGEIDRHRGDDEILRHHNEHLAAMGGFPHGRAMSAPG